MPLSRTLTSILSPNRGPSLRQVARSLRRSPWYAATVLGVVALTASLAATVFAVVDGVLFKSLPYPDAGQLRTASGLRPNGRGGGALSFDEIRAWQRDLPDIPIAGFQWAHDAGTLGDGLLYGAAMVDDRFFDVLGQRPLLGGFAPEHFTPGAPPVALISYRLWQRTLGGDMDILGRELPLAGAIDNVARPIPRPIVVGVLPPDFVYPTGEMTDIVWPAALTAADSAGRNESAAVGLIRLPRGVAVDAIQARLDDSTRRAQTPDRSANSTYTGASIRTLETLGIPYRRSFARLAQVAGALLLLGCVAVATLSTARARQQERQTVVRRALGAGSWDLFRGALVEALCLTTAGGLLGLIAAPRLLDLTLALLPVQAPFVKAPSIDGRVIALAGAFAIAAALAIATASVRLSRRSPFTGPGMTGSTRGVRHFGRVLIGVQTALAFVLVLGGALGFSSLQQAWTIDPGYDPAALVVIDINARHADVRQVQADVARLNDRFSSLPGVQSGIFGGPFLRNGWMIASGRARADEAFVDFHFIPAGGALFDVLGLTAIEGRLPTSNEFAGGSEVVVVSRRTAARLWPGASAVGRTLLLGRRAVTVIGVVADVQFAGLTAGPAESGQIYSPGPGGRQATFVLRATAGPPRAVIEAARRVLAESGTNIDLIRATTMSEALGDTITDRRLAAWLHGGFATSALAIVATAVLGLVAMVTSLRAREFGIRQALGARREWLIGMLVREQLATVGVGLAVGMVVAYWAQGMLRNAVAGVSPTDVRVWLAAAATICVVSLAGVLIPAMRSTKTGPAVSLRHE